MKCAIRRSQYEDQKHRNHVAIGHNTVDRHTTCNWQIETNHSMKRAPSQARFRHAATRGHPRLLPPAAKSTPVSRPPLSTTVSGLAAAAGVTPHVIRYYTRIGLIEPMRDPGNNYKRFNEHHLARLNFIRGAQVLGYTLSEIRRIFGHAERGYSPCPEVRDILLRRIGETREHLRDLRELQQRMERALRNWEKMKDGTPDGRSVCVLIESTLSGAEHEIGVDPEHVRASKQTKTTRRKHK